MVNYLVTVVIVNYNAGPMLEQCLKQVLASTLPVKVIISDNASSDDSLSLIEKNFIEHPDVLIHRNQINAGFSAGNNAVYPYINTPFILYLNPDCFVQTDTIEQLLNTMNNHPNAGMVGCLVTNPDGTEQSGCRGLTPTPARVFNQMFGLRWRDQPFSGYILSNQALPDEPISVELISGSCMFVRKSAIEEVGLLDENYFLYCEDYDWFYRFIKKNWTIIFTPKTQVMHIKSYTTRRIPFKVLVYKARGMWRYHNKFFKDEVSALTTLCVRIGILARLSILGTLALIKNVWYRRI